MKGKFDIFCRIIYLTLLVVLIMGCASPKQLPDVPIQNINRYKTYQNQNGIGVAIDPFIEQERLVQYFGRDLLYYGLLPIHILIENNNNKPLLILTKDIVLYSDHGIPIIGESLAWAKEPINKESRERRLGVSAGAMLFPGVGIFMMMAELLDRAEAQTVLINISSKALNDKSIFSGEGYNGFIYFPLRDIFSEIKSLYLEIRVRELSTNKITLFEHNINSEGLKKRIKELRK